MVCCNLHASFTLMNIHVCVFKNKQKNHVTYLYVLRCIFWTEFHLLDTPDLQVHDASFFSSLLDLWAVLDVTAS